MNDDISQSRNAGELDATAEADRGQHSRAEGALLLEEKAEQQAHSESRETYEQDATNEKDRERCLRTVEKLLLEAVAKQKECSEAATEEVVAKAKSQAEAAAVEETAALAAKFEDTLTRCKELEENLKLQESELAKVNEQLQSEIVQCERVEKEHQGYRDQGQRQSSPVLKYPGDADP